MIFYYHANKTHFHKKGFALGLVLRVRDFGTRKWPICFEFSLVYCLTLLCLDVGIALVLVFQHSVKKPLHVLIIYNKNCFMYHPTDYNQIPITEIIKNVRESVGEISIWRMKLPSTIK